MSIAFPSNLQQRLSDLGDIELSRIVTVPSPGSATVDDLLRLRVTSSRSYELVDGTLVEKAMGWRESLLAAVIIKLLGYFLDQNRLGVVTGPDGLMRIYGSTVRGPDVAFVAWNRLPGGKIPDDPIPAIVPNFVVEILSQSNTYGEMSRKRREYFQAGVEVVWMVDLRERSITVYSSVSEYVTLDDGDMADAGHVLPGWQLDVRLLFDELDRGREN
jgi:Uma2 family endonuclease